MSLHFDTKHIAAAISKKRQGRSFNSRSVANPELAWLVACTSFIVFFLISVGASVLWYQHLRALSTSVESNYQSDIPHYSAILVDEVHKEFVVRQESFDAFINQPVVDVPVSDGESDSTSDEEVDSNDMVDAFEVVDEVLDAGESIDEQENTSADELDNDTLDTVEVTPEF